MKRTIKSRLFSGFFAVIIFIGCFTYITPTAHAEESDNIVITIDPGHGGRDPGNTKASELFGNGSIDHYESKHVYDISLYIKERLLQYLGVEVYLTRGDLSENEEKPENESRADIAKAYNSDAFISIHTNTYDTKISGTEIFVPSAKISFNNQIAITSENAARTILSSMVKQTGVKNRGLKAAIHESETYPNEEAADDLAVIRGGRKNEIPVVMLIETAFADNESDFNNHLATTEKRKEMGYAIADGLATYYKLSLMNFSATYGDTLADVSLPDGWSWENPDSTVGNAGVNFHSAIFTRADGSTHKDNLSVTVKKASPEYTVPQNLTTQLKSKLSKTKLPEGWSFENGNLVPDTLGTYTATLVFTPEDTKNFLSVKVDVQITVICTDHIYENSCDTECECGYTREATHTYSNSCDAYCNVCSYKRTPGDHKYSNSCDAFCDICSYKRTPDDHKYTNDCDAICDVCSRERTPKDHVYTNACDTDCDVCGMIRTPKGHTYDNTCDNVCNVCNNTREINHTYSSDKDTECDICGFERTVEIPEEPQNNGCGATISSVFAIITAIAVSFFITKKKQ